MSRQESFPIHRTYSCSMSNHGEWISGSVITKTHLVNAYTQDGHTRLDTVHAGKHVMLTIPRRMTARGMTTVAARWVRRLSKGNP